MKKLQTGGEKMKKIKAIIFDYFKTITFESELGVWRQYDPDGINKKETNSLMDEYDKGQSFTWLCQEVSRVNRIPVNELEAVYNNQPELELNLELIDLIKNELKNKYKVSLLSNVGSEPKQLSIINSHMFFDDKLLSFEVGIIKPDPAIYILAAKRLGVKPEECVFVDDMIVNVEAAESTGMKGIIFKDYDDFSANLKIILENTNINK